MDFELNNDKCQGNFHLSINQKHVCIQVYIEYDQQ